MPRSRTQSQAVDDYVARQPPKIRARLRETRHTIHRAGPDLVEKISYRMPAFTLNGRIVVYLGAFKAHIGLFPPVKADARLAKALSVYANERGNLRFPLDRSMPYDLIARVVKARIAQLGAR
jgi:uncharacterized protein YdhG (YjbR/CyaY superfamily)